MQNHISFLPLWDITVEARVVNDALGSWDMYEKRKKGVETCQGEKKRERSDGGRGNLVFASCSYFLFLPFLKFRRFLWHETGREST